MSEFFGDFLVEPLGILLLLILRLIGYIPVYWCVKVFGDRSKTYSQIWKDYKTNTACTGIIIVIISGFIFFHYFL